MSIASDMADEGQYAVKRLAEIEQARKDNRNAILSRVDTLMAKAEKTPMPLTGVLLASHALGMVEAAEVAGLLDLDAAIQLTRAIDVCIHRKMLDLAS